jgi:hypothetical protein
MSDNRRWTADMDALLRELWKSESAGAIARTGVLPGKSKNAIIGRVHRIGAAKMAKQQPKPRLRAKKKRVLPNLLFGKGPLVSPVAPRARGTPLPPTVRGLPLLQLGPTDCRFIITEATRNHLYCAADASQFADQYGNNCYCGFHRRLMHAGHSLAGFV